MQRRGEQSPPREDRAAADNSAEGSERQSVQRQQPPRRRRGPATIPRGIRPTAEAGRSDGAGESRSRGQRGRIGRGEGLRPFPRTPTPFPFGLSVRGWGECHVGMEHGSDAPKAQTQRGAQQSRSAKENRAGIGRPMALRGTPQTPLAGGKGTPSASGSSPAFAPPAHRSDRTARGRGPGFPCW